MGRLSRGCFKCRQRRVRCDQGRPSCQRCIKRNEVCEGYRDEATLTFRYPHARVAAAGNSTSRAAIGFRHRSRSVDGRSPVSSKDSVDSSHFTPDEATSFLHLPSHYPWLKQVPQHAQVQKEDRAVEQFMDKYVMYPCNETSSPGFLEHLPSLFKEVNVEGRYALRWAIRAAAYAEAARESEGSHIAQKALYCYGEALSALGASLAESGKTPDDFDLMTIALFLQDISQVGTHTQRMAQILRLRGSDQFYNPRGWSLFRLAHHRIQKHQLAFNQPALSESTIWLDQLNDRVPFSLQELYELDQTASSWHQGPQWHFNSVSISDLSLDLPVPPLTRDVELHGDVWKAYELNYHRTARILFHQQLLKVLEAILAKPGIPELMVLSLHDMMDRSTNTAYALVESILATVPQSLGDIDHLGHVPDARNGIPKCRSIGCYLLLWPIKIIKAPGSAASLGQKAKAQSVYERIRDCTGMTSRLGDLSVLP
ncbi:Zn2/Cys6 DNA-binding protein [Apiospora phragmitis]|uniref:Zn2/Cys6 DNA-binding protein n=1 Tax=Apiospora phragmitis TaxID=2905665 RepID=A0ABR1T9K7_9PEZI